MSRLLYSVSISLDGFVAGLDQTVDNPLGVGGLLLHGWMRELAAWREAAGQEGGVTNASTAVVERDDDDTVGAIIMGRNMFGGGPGPWGDDPWNGWWGENPPQHLPVFVLTHYPRPRLTCMGGTSFEFVTGGIEAALKLARAAADGKDVAVSGGGTVARQYLAAGLLDEIELHLVPVILGAGVRLFDDKELAGTRMEQVEVIEAPEVTHIRYRVRP